MTIVPIPRIFLAAAFFLTAVLFAPATAEATPITYNLTLIPSDGSTYGGTGSFTIETPPAASGISYYKVGSSLDSLNIVVDGF